VTFAYGYATGFRRKEPRCQTEAYLRGWEDGQADRLRCDGWVQRLTDGDIAPWRSHAAHNRGQPATVSPSLEPEPQVAPRSLIPATERAGA
jgi:hypothetical protein